MARTCPGGNPGRLRPLPDAPEIRRDRFRTRRNGTWTPLGRQKQGKTKHNRVAIVKKYQYNTYCMIAYGKTVHNKDHDRKINEVEYMSMAKDIGIDLGTASVLVFVKGKGIVLNEPSVVALDKNTGKLLKVGTEAQAMLGRTPGNIVAIRPLREGVISDYDMTEKMLKEFIHKVAGVSFFKPRVIICVPSGITEVEERAVIDAGIQAGARKVYLIEEPVAAAIGAGIDIAKPDGHMVVDIGGGTADIAVISLSGVVESASIKIAGDQLNEAVVKYMRRKHNLLVGERTAEEMKKQIGCVFPKEEEETMDVKGRCLLTGLPKVVTVSSTEMMDAFEEPVERIMEAIHAVLERTPPELVADISTNGIIMTGGGSLVSGFDKLVTARTGIHTEIAEDAISCVALGTGKSLDSLNSMQDGTMNLSRRKQMN